MNKKVQFPLFLAIAFLASALLACKPKSTSQQGAEAVAGRFNHASGETLYLEELTPEGIKLLDTASLASSGEFKFLSAKPHLGFYRIRITESNFAMLVLDSNQQVKLSGDVQDLTHSMQVEGSPDTKFFNEMNDTTRFVMAKRDSIMRAFEVFANQNKLNKAALDSYSRQAEIAYTACSQHINDYLMHFIKQHTNSIVAVLALQQLAPINVEDNFFETYKLVDSVLTIRYPNASTLKAFHANVAALKSTQVGMKAPDFTIEGPDGKTVNLYQAKAKYTVLDFWASWCMPCRAESPKMVQLYQKYHTKGLQIIGISLDNDKSKWQAAIEKDHLSWTHVSQLQGWKSPVARMYNVSQIPNTYLLDENKKILAKGLRADEIDEWLIRSNHE